MTRRLRRALALVAALAAPGAAAAQAPTAGELPVFRALDGAWEGAGDLMGRTARFTMTWTVEPSGAVRLDFSNAFVDDAGTVTPVLAAVARYRTDADGRVVARWTDDRPQEIEIVAEAGDSVLTSAWTAATERGRTEYRLLPGGGARVRDWVEVDGALRLFGEATYRRREAGRAVSR